MTEAEIGRAAEIAARVATTTAFTRRAVLENVRGEIRQEVAGKVHRCGRYSAANDYFWKVDG